uniref:Uncharacterized protein n=1 Tax=Cacopsylla melanoneura TaxID=428564 RepID=A0A8D8ZBB2_9HEMI
MILSSTLLTHVKQKYIYTLYAWYVDRFNECSNLELLSIALAKQCNTTEVFFLFYFVSLFLPRSHIRYYPMDVMPNNLTFFLRYFASRSNYSEFYLSFPRLTFSLQSDRRNR